MNKQVSPVMTAVIIACAVVILGVVIWRAMTAQSSYPGQNAGHPAAEQGRIAPTTTTTPQQAAGHISGAPPMAAQGH
jgi:predicted lipid-binding transport protein (Tim44 family)